MKRRRVERRKKKRYPIKHWSHSSLMAFLRNPLAWYKRYVEQVYDTPTNPASVIGRAGHLALEHFYRGTEKEVAIALGLEYLRKVPDFELNFGKAKTKKAKKEKRAAMERDYLQAITFYLAKPPKHTVLGAEVRGVAEVEGIPLPIKAISDLVVESKIEQGAVDVVDHKFVDSFSKGGATKTLFIIQALFNYYTVREMYGRPVRQFIVYECKKTKNADGSPQLRRYAIDFKTCREEFKVFHRLINDATEEMMRRRIYLPNPSDMFEGDHSFDIYRLGLVDDVEDDPTNPPLTASTAPRPSRQHTGTRRESRKAPGPSRR
ncbi:MAG TPA: PD-(D/E)XK nuclease family protein [Candidatus Paceibacterota bacterium]|nr:PD-(D/E)XK nuclease family protein [Candidatus Paceibacterota bacterium]